LFDVDDNPKNPNNPNNNKNIIINKINKYYSSNTSKSVFNIKYFEMSKENFHDWYEPLTRHFICQWFRYFYWQINWY